MIKLVGLPEKIVFVSSILIIFCTKSTVEQTTCEPVNFGLICSIPWDISNTLRAPLGGPISLLLASLFACMLLFGLLLAPVNYILGYPSRIYHTYREPGLIHDALYGDGFPREKRMMDVFSVVNKSIDLYEENTALIPGIQLDRNQIKSSSYPDFISSAFFLIPEEDTDCQNLMLCHAHGFLQIIPAKVTKIIQFFSKRTMSITSENKAAVLLGLTDQAECEKVYKCSKDMTMIFKEMLFSFIPNDTKKLWNLKKSF